MFNGREVSQETLKKELKKRGCLLMQSSLVVQLFHF